MISHAYRCIFVHCPKVAGQSVEQAFVDAEGLTWESREALLLRRNRDPSAGPPRLAHLRAADYVACGHVDRATFDAYFKFAFVRDPYERMRSFHAYLGGPEPTPLSDFVKGAFAEDLWTAKHWFVRPQADFLHGDDGRLLVDFVGRFERIEADFAHVSAHVGLPDDGLPRRNVSSGTGSRAVRRLRSLARRVGIGTRTRPAHELMDAAARDVVESLFAADFDAFGYARATR